MSSLQHLQGLNLGMKTGKNTASRQQDAHGPEKDDWLDPGNGENSRGRRYFRGQLCFNRRKKTGAQRDIFVDLSPDHKKAEELLAIARVKCGCGGNSCNQHFSYISVLLLFSGLRDLKNEHGIQLFLVNVTFITSFF